MSTIVSGLKRLPGRLPRLGICTVLLVGYDRRNPGATVNAAVALAMTFVPGVLERRYGVVFRPWQRLWVSTAMFLHSLGMLGPYDRVWWWDHVTHTLSATLVGGVAYVVARTHTRRGGRQAVPRRYAPEFVVGVTMGFGLLWEALEYGIHSLAGRFGFTPLLVSYGRIDTALDLVFDLVGAGLVVLFGPTALENVVRALGGHRDEEA